jgi:DNA-binding ferritin-like protein
MVSTSKKLKRARQTRRKKDNIGNYVGDYVDIVNMLMELKHSVKIYHWTTEEYRIHITTDGYLKQLDPLIDQYTEVMLGLTKKTSHKNKDVVNKLKNTLSTIKVVPLDDIGDLNNILNKVVNILKIHERISNDPELLAIRDEIVSETQKFKYLIAFKE